MKNLINNLIVMMLGLFLLFGSTATAQNWTSSISDQVRDASALVNTLNVGVSQVHQTSYGVIVRARVTGSINDNSGTRYQFEWTDFRGSSIANGPSARLEFGTTGYVFVTDTYTGATGSAAFRADKPMTLPGISDPNPFKRVRRGH